LPKTLKIVLANASDVKLLSLLMKTAISAFTAMKPIAHLALVIANSMNLKKWNNYFLSE